MNAALPLEPGELATLSTPERGAIYRALDLHPLEIAAAEEACRAVVAGRYGRPRHGPRPLQLSLLTPEAPR
jgi:hypothetical protein